MRTLLLLLSLGGLSCASAPAPSARAAPTLPVKRPQLPESARMLLGDRMQHHGQAMSDIMWSVLFLDFEAAGEIAEEIAREPRIARPISRSAAELNSALPALFFDYQDQLVERAQRLAVATDTEDPETVSTALGALSQTCVRCHATFLDP